MENNIEIYPTPEQLAVLEKIEDLAWKYFRGEVDRFEVNEIIYGMIDKNVALTACQQIDIYIHHKTLFDYMYIKVVAKWREQQINSILED